MSIFDQYKPIRDLIKGNYVLLDLPYHINVGDLLIWEGEMSFLRHEVKYKMLGYYNQSTFGFPNLKKDTVILLHGGGNFGNVWRRSQEFRLEVIKRYPNNRIVIFPQSVYYSTDDLAVSDAKAFAEHKDLTICARDNVSFGYLKRFFSNMLLCIPDMAFCIDRDIFLSNIQDATKENLFFKRTDHENREVVIDFISGDYDTLDWPDVEKLPFYMKFFYLSMIVIARMHRSNKVLRLFAVCLSWIINVIFMHIIRPVYIGKGVRFISTYKNVYTTRLHGLILSHFLDKRIFIVSNNNGKLENYYNSWLKDCENISIIKC